MCYHPFGLLTKEVQLYIRVDFSDNIKTEPFLVGPFESEDARQAFWDRFWKSLERLNKLNQEEKSPLVIEARLRTQSDTDHCLELVPPDIGAVLGRATAVTAIAA